MIRRRLIAPRPHSRQPVLAAAALVFAALLGLSSCAIEDDSGPRDIGENSRSDFLDPSTQAVGTAAGSDRIYLLSPAGPDEPRSLRASARNVGDTAEQRLTSLFGPITVVEDGARLRTALPDDIELLSAVLQTSGTLVVDVSDQLLTLSSSTLIDAVAQIVFTAAEVQGVQRVQLKVDGAARQWPGSDGELQAEPLTVYNYPGFVESTQPDFPAVPSPGDT